MANIGYLTNQAISDLTEKRKIILSSSEVSRALLWLVPITPYLILIGKISIKLSQILMNPLPILTKNHDIQHFSR